MIFIAGQTTEDESLFTYGAGLSHSSFKDSNFVPLFNLSLANSSDATRAEAASLCGLSNECLFDYLLTGKRSLAIASADAVLQHEEFINSSKPGRPYSVRNEAKRGNRLLNCCCSGDIALNARDFVIEFTTRINSNEHNAKAINSV